MSNEMIRIRVVMPKSVVDEVNRLIEPRHRSAFVTAAVAEKLSRERLRRAALRLGGSLTDKDIPGWESTESAAQWVRSLRHGSNKFPNETYERPPS